MPIVIDRVGLIQQHNIQDVISQGSISMGGKTYSVAVVNDRIQVQRQGLEQMSTGGRIANGIKDFFGRLFGEGALTTRASRLQSTLQGMLVGHQVSESVENFREELDLARQVLQGHTPQHHAEASVETMSDDPTVQQFLLDHLNDPNYSSATFTGIEEHPTDSSKFIAKFGEHQLVFSNRGSTSGIELRGTRLKEQLADGTYQNLGQLIGQSYLTEKDGFFVGVCNALIQPLAARFESYPQGTRDQIMGRIRDTIDQEPTHPTVGDAFGDKISSML